MSWISDILEEVIDVFTERKERCRVEVADVDERRREDHDKRNRRQREDHDLFDFGD
ncbi:hypothetical protein [Ponticaulis koreensis]|uniref:hypothetical protein n=1 Tax=Ponticaulis koreensis TaxID=1123045 RepID=UPI0003B3CC4E|nr:hypothetical protein [Ponticaulis koreensis]